MNQIILEREDKRILILINSNKDYIILFRIIDKNGQIERLNRDLDNLRK